MRAITERVEEAIRREIIYARGIAVMHRERYLACSQDLRAAQERGDATQARAIIGDLRDVAVGYQAAHCREQAAYARLVRLIAGHGFTDAIDRESQPAPWAPPED